MSETTKEHRDCLAKGFPFWNDLTPDEQDMLCRYTRPVHYAKGARVHSPLESCVGILLLLSPMLPVIGYESGGGQLWLRFGSFSFQPGELAKILFVCFIAAYLAANREMLSVFTW